VGRRTNVALLFVLAVAFLTGWTAFAFANAGSRWSLVVHSVAGVAVLALVPWKSVVARRGVARRRPGWWVSMLLGLVVLVSILGGLAHATGLLRWVGWLTAMEVHVGAAFLAVPLVVWHVLARPQRLRRTDLGRRHLLRGAGLLVVAGAAYGASEVVVRATGLPGAGRRFTGSYEVGSLRPDLLPVTQWLLDPVPEISASGWRLALELGAERVSVPYSELARYSDRVRATLDCTGGFWSEQDWEGVWLSRLIGGSSAGALSVRVVSVTGYFRRFDISLAPRLLLATRLGGQALDAGHGHPLRLVAPERRGFEWVKWVAAVHVEAVPWWWQPPFPLR
jgi:DMSO/TMAO reductase YedYZ molybdopterin-dependent catalytic subunit